MQIAQGTMLYSQGVTDIARYVTPPKMPDKVT